MTKCLNAVQRLSLLVLFFVVSFVSSTEGALRIGVDERDQTLIRADNDQAIEGATGYLFWVDLDEYGKNASGLMSWTPEGWQEGLHQVSDHPFFAPVVEGLSITHLPRACPRGHRCFVGGALLAPSLDEPIFSIFPLTKEAALERLPGQWRFAVAPRGLLSLTGSNQPDVGLQATTSGSSETQSREQVEKPDLYKIVPKTDTHPQLLLIALTEAKKMVAVDVEGPDTPHVVATFSLDGSPKEIYSLNGTFYVLSYGGNHTRLASFRWSGETLQRGDTLELSGAFRESRRKGDVVYVVADVGGGYPQGPIPLDQGQMVQTRYGQETRIYGVGLGRGGELTLLSSKEVEGHPEVVSMCEFFLTLAMRGASDGSRTTLDVTALGDAKDPFEAQFSIDIPGRIPSDRHISCFSKGGEEYLTVVAGPTWSNRRGSTFYVFKRTKDREGSGGLEEVGSIDGIAPGEDLYGTVITGERAYVVTYERKDPLWVIDFSDPSHPSIVGELTLPGWSEKLFIDGDRLFSLGYLDTAQGGAGGGIRLVSMGLFDISDPLSPRLTARVTPFLGEYNYSWSEATRDERALFLHWGLGLCALPLEVYQADQDNWISACRLEDQTILGFDPEPIPFMAERVLWLDDSHLAAFSTRELMTFEGEYPEITPRFRLPLVLAVDWLSPIDAQTMLGLSKEDEIYRAFTLNGDCILSTNGTNGCIEQELQVPSGLNGALGAKENNGTFLLYNAQRSKIAFLRVKSGGTATLKGPYELSFGGGERSSLGYPPYYSRGLVVFPYYKYSQAENEEPFNGIYAIFEGDLGEADAPYEGTILSIPGTVLGLSASSMLLTAEYGASPTDVATATLNLLEVRRNQAILKATSELKGCSIGSYYIDGNYVYIGCTHARYPVPLLDGPVEGVGPTGVNGTLVNAPSGSAPREDGLPKLLVFHVSKDHLVKEAQYGLDSPFEEIVKADSQSGLLLTAFYGGIYLEGVRSLMPWYGTRCRLYKMTEGARLIKLMEFSDDWCAHPDRVLLGEKWVVIAHGIEGVKVERQ